MASNGLASQGGALHMQFTLTCRPPLALSGLSQEAFLEMCRQLDPCLLSPLEVHRNESLLHALPEFVAHLVHGLCEACPFVNKPSRMTCSRLVVSRTFDIHVLVMGAYLGVRS